MKLLQIAKTIGTMLSLDLEKRAGVFVSRKLLPHSAKAWHDWAVRHNVPNPLPPEELHVTIIHSSVDVKMPLSQVAMNIPAASEHAYQSGAFAMFGEEEDHLVFAFRAWELHDRHWMFLDQGAVTNWPNYRPHLTISSEASGFELPDEALTDMPSWIVLGPEVAETPRVKMPETTDSLAEVGEDLKSEAADLVKAGGEFMSIIDAYDLADIAKGRMSQDVAKRLGSMDWGPASLKAAVQSAPAEVRKRVEQELTISISQLPDNIAKTLGQSAIAKGNDEEQIVLGIASVSTVNGVLLKDLHGDEIRTKALVEFNRSLISGSRAGKFLHEGEVRTSVVAGLVLTDDWQKSLGIELGYEPYLVEIHVPDATDWAEVKKGEWMLSIAGTMWYYEDAADADV